MNSTPIRSRDNHCFVSYASEDAELASKFARWLQSAGLNIWFDQTRLSAGAPVLDELTIQMGNSRACVVLLTETALKKNYVKHEVDIALSEQVNNRDFTVIAALVDPGLDPTDRFPALSKLGWMNLPQGKLDVPLARRMLLSVTRSTSQANSDRHVFVSCGWGESEEPLVRRVCSVLSKRQVRLVGDAKDQYKFGEDGKERVRRIMAGCTGHLMILPNRRSLGKTSEQTYKYFLAEWETSRSLGLARQTLCVSRSALPPQLQSEAIEIGDGHDENLIEEKLVELHDVTEPNGPYAFLATDYKYNAARNEAAREIIQHVLGMECWLGKDYPTDRLREAIVEKLIGSNLVFADLSCARDEHTNRLRPNVNTCIESGIAMGARRPVFVTALNPASFDPEVTDKTTQVPFMFRNSQIHWYGSDVEYLATVHRLAMATRRRIINDELA